MSEPQTSLKRILFAGIKDECRFISNVSSPMSSGVPQSVSTDYEELKKNCINLAGYNTGNMFIGESVMRIFEFDRTKSVCTNFIDLFRLMNNPGTINAYCSSTDVLKTRKTCYTGTLCYEGSCIKPACTSNASCGTSGAGVKICEGNNVVQTYNQYTCNNPSTPQAVCSNQQTTTFVESCVNGCSAGKCLPPPCGFSDGIIVSAESKPFTAWDISKVQLTISYKSGAYTKTATLSKNGNEIYSGEGSYATSSSCGGICNWISGSQVIVGALDSNP
jgi:hypothetical protein